MIQICHVSTCSEEYCRTRQRCLRAKTEGEENMLEGHLPEASEILPGLWMGSHPNTIYGYDYVLNVTGKPQYPILSGQIVVVAPFEDIETSMPKDSFLLDLAGQVWSAHFKGKKVLIHCTAGINRSALIMTLVLMMNGWPSHRAIKHLRQTRGDVLLFNRTFEKWLLDQDTAVKLELE